jgi:chorismate--pyruvate lyase
MVAMIPRRYDHGPMPYRCASPAHPRLQAWLHAQGSLTARLRAHGQVDVQVQHEGNQRLWPQEQADLRWCSGYVREVILLLDGSPIVWARSATTHPALHGPWRALTQLGNRPLAELLFQGRQVRRDPLRKEHLMPCGPVDQRLRAQWQALLGNTPTAGFPRWARSSVFWHCNQPLRVMEAFAPSIIGLDADT